MYASFTIRSLNNSIVDVLVSESAVQVGLLPEQQCMLILPYQPV